jgi:hypothetical protein
MATKLPRIYATSLRMKEKTAVEHDVSLDMHHKYEATAVPSGEATAVPSGAATISALNSTVPHITWLLSNRHVNTIFSPQLPKGVEKV